MIYLRRCALNSTDLAQILLAINNAQLSEKVKILYLDYNNIAVLPEAIDNLTALTELYVAFKKLTELPVAIGKLTALTVLQLFVNQLTTLPESIGKLTSLTFLNLNNN